MIWDRKSVRWNIICHSPPFLPLLLCLCALSHSSHSACLLFLQVARNRAMEKKRKEYEAEQVQQNIKMREQEHLITLQQQQLLEAELSAKSKDLASMALGVFAKNEVLEKLRTVVQESLVKGQYGRKNLESLLKLINENIETQEFWDVFQNNFDLIHEKFFRNLRERYPSLTATDLRFVRCCA